MNNNVKETVIQFGEDGSLRGFVNYFFYELQEKGLYDGKIVAVQPIERGMCQMLTDQNCEYNLFPHGIDNGEVINEHTRVASISRALNLYTRYEEYTALAESPDIRVLVPNTTEVGIEYIGTEKSMDMSLKSCPVKLCQFLYKRHKAGLKGLIFLPCELIDGNGGNPKKCVLQHADLWELEDGFKDWIENESDFCNTLVDRIVIGYSRDEVEELTKQIDCEDKLIDTAEIFHLWVIGGYHEGELPFRKAGYNVVWTDDVYPYKKRRVRILNGGHTSMVLGAYLYGFETVGECMKDEKVSSLLKKYISEEIIPIIGDTEDNRKFGVAALERFSNPSIKHLLLNVILNSVSKSQVRILPTILKYREKFGKYPTALIFFVAVLIPLYRTGKASNGEETLQSTKTASMEDIIKRQDHWYEDLSEMIPMVREYYDLIQGKGTSEAYSTILAK